MAKIIVLKKDGQLLEIEVKETVKEIWQQMNFKGGLSPDYEVNENSYFYPFNKEFLILTEKTGKKLILNKHFIFHVIDA